MIAVLKNAKCVQACKNQVQFTPSDYLQVEKESCCVPIKKEELAAEVRRANKTNHEVGECNCAINFKSGKEKVIILYMDVFDDEIKEKLLSSKLPFEAINGEILKYCYFVTFTEFQQDFNQQPSSQRTESINWCKKKYIKLCTFITAEKGHSNLTNLQLTQSVQGI